MKASEVGNYNKLKIINRDVPDNILYSCFYSFILGPFPKTVQENWSERRPE